MALEPRLARRTGRPWRLASWWQGDRAASLGRVIARAPADYRAGSRRDGPREGAPFGGWLDVRRPARGGEGEEKGCGSAGSERIRRPAWAAAEGGCGRPDWAAAEDGSGRRLGPRPGADGVAVSEGLDYDGRGHDRGPQFARDGSAKIRRRIPARLSSSQRPTGRGLRSARLWCDWVDVAWARRRFSIRASAMTV